MEKEYKNISNPVFGMDRIQIRVQNAAVTYVEPYTEYAHDWRFFPFSVLTSIDPDADPDPGSSILKFPDGSRHYYVPGSTILLPRHVRHKFASLDKPHTAVWMHWDVSLAPDVDLFRFYDIPRIITGELSCEIRKRNHEITECPADTLAGQVRRKALLYSLLDLLLSSFPMKKHYQDFRLHYSKFAPLLCYIEQNLNQRILLEDAARFQQCSVSKLQQEFRSAFGMSVGHFILQKRLEQAVRLLCHTTQKLEEIAENTGFSNAFALSKSFKQHYGISPKDYRKSAKDTPFSG